MRLSLSLCPVTLSGTAPAPRVRLEALCSKFEPLSQAIGNPANQKVYHYHFHKTSSFTINDILDSTWESLLTFYGIVNLLNAFIEQQLLHDLDLVGGKFCLVHGKHS
jgi:hypothetical protein